MPAPDSDNSTKTIFKLEVLTPSGDFVPVSTETFQFRRAVITETVDGYSKAEIHVRTSGLDFVNRILKLSGKSGDPRIRFRLGLGGDSETDYLPWQEHVLLSHTEINEGLASNSAHSVKLETIDQLWLLSRNTKTISRSGTISSIVEAIAKEHGIEDFVIEETLGSGRWYQSFNSDFKFIKERMVGRAVNKKNRGNFKLYMKDNALHFHSLDYSASYVELSLSSSSASPLKTADFSQQLIGLGASSATMTTYDPNLGQGRIVHSNPDNYLRLEGYTPDLSSVKRTSLDLKYHLGNNPVWEAEAITQNAFASARSRMYVASFRIEKQPFIRAGDIININIHSLSSQQSTWNGLYSVSKITHAVESSAITSSCEITRGELSSATRNFESINALTGSTVAKGQLINIKELASSTLTKGSGASSDRRSYVTSQEVGN